MTETKFFNSFSTRSPLILTIKLIRVPKLVDLAGSAKVSKTGAKSETLEEANNIFHNYPVMNYMLTIITRFGTYSHIEI